MNSDASAASAPIPAETGAALKHLGWLLEQDLPDVRPNQIWRATWDEVTTTGVVLDTDEADSIAEFAPFTVDTDYADPYTGIVPAFDNPIGVDLAVFAGLTTPIAMFTLDRWLGDLDPSATSCLYALWRANLAGLPPKDSSLETGHPTLTLSTLGATTATLCAPKQHTSRLPTSRTMVRSYPTLTYRSGC